MYTMDENDLLRLYATLNAHQHLLTTCVATIMHLAGDDRERAREAMRTAAMDLADRQNLRPGEPNVDFGRRGQIETLRLVADFFERLKPGSGPEAGTAAPA